MDTTAVVLEKPEHLVLSRLDLSAPSDDDVVVDVEWSGISTGTERLLWAGHMPHFPGMGYPLVPGYESVGRVTEAGPGSGRHVGDRVFVPGAQCFGDIRSLFGGAAARLVVPGTRVQPVDEDLGENAILLALAATAQHAIAGGARKPDLIIGHGILGRLLARIAVQAGGDPPVVWEQNAERAEGARGYCVVDPAQDPRRDYQAIYDASGDAALLNELITRIAPGGEIVLAGFYSEPLSFDFAPAFMREARIRVAAEWQQADLLAIKEMAERKHLSLSGLITHRQQAADAPAAYRTAFSDPGCLKMILDWRTCS